MLRDYRYNLIRYVADSERMEPVNVGVILQGGGRVDVRINPDTARREDVDTDNFRRWKSFFIKEIQTEQVPLFQPDRNSEGFLRYLERLCNGPVYLSRALALQVSDQYDFDNVLANLYIRLVAPPSPAPREEEKRPTGAFRRWAEEKRFLERGMRRHTHVIVQQKKLWTAYRQVDNGEAIALDKVEVGRQIGSTSNEIERLPLIAGQLTTFLKSKINGKRTRYFLLADELNAAFTGQSPEEFELMRRDLEEHVDAVRRRGGNIIRSPLEAAGLAADLDKRLPPPSKK